MREQVRSGWAVRSLMPLGAAAVIGCGRIGYDVLAVPSDGAPSVSGSDGAGPGGADAAGSVDGPPGSEGGSSGQAADSGSAPEAGTDASADASLVDAGNALTGTISVTNPAAWVLNGNAQLGSGELDLTTNTRTVAGAAYLPQPYAIGPSTSFTIAFSFRLYGSVGSSGDGFAFLWQNDPRGTAAIGGAGGQLGYAGITPSVDVEFDVLQNSYDPAPNDIAITTNGQNMTSLANQSPSFSIYDGATHYAWIEYQAATHTVSVFVSQSTPTQPATALVSASVDLYATVGSSAYIGFTGGTGVSDEYHAIESLMVQYSP